MLRLEKITKDINHPERYILWVTTNDEMVHNWYVKRIDNSTLFAKVAKSGMCQYGLQQNIDGPEHKAGYIWSSRPGVINRHFTLQIVGAYVNGCAGKAITVEAAKKLLPKKFELVKLNNIEPTYIIIKKNNFKEKLT